MHFLVDECVGSSVVRWLRENDHDAASVYEDCREWEDESIGPYWIFTWIDLKPSDKHRHIADILALQDNRVLVACFWVAHRSQLRIQ